MGMALNQILDLDERNQVLRVQIWKRLYWTDEFLQWDPTDYNGTNSVRLDPNRVWTPDIVIYNDAGGYETFHDFLVSVESDGSVTWLIPVILTSSCLLDVLYFPWDVQHCPIEFGSWSYDGFKLDIYNRSSTGDNSGVLESGEFEKPVITAERRVAYYKCCPNPYPSIIFYIRLERRSLYYLANLVIPFTLISFTGALVFYLPPDSGEKMSLSVTVLLASTVFQLLVAEILPPQSKVVPLISRYLTGSMVLLVLSTVLTTFVIHSHHAGSMGFDVPWLVRKIFFGFLAKVVCLKKVVDKESTDVTLVKPISCGQNILHQKDIVMDDIEDVKTNTHNAITDKAGLDSNPKHIVIDDIEDIKTNTHNVITDKTSLNSTNSILLDILATMRTQGSNTNDITESRRKDWILVALVLDRLFLGLFLILNITVTCVVLLTRPH